MYNEKLIKQIEKCSQWYKMVKSGQKGSNYQNLSKMVSNVLKRLNYFKWFQISIMVRFAPLFY